MYECCEQQEIDYLVFTTFVEVDKYPLGLSIQQDFSSRFDKTRRINQESNIVSLLPEEEVAKLIQYLLEA